MKEHNRVIQSERTKIPFATSFDRSQFYNIFAEISHKLCCHAFYGSTKLIRLDSEGIQVSRDNKSLEPLSLQSWKDRNLVTDSELLISSHLFFISPYIKDRTYPKNTNDKNEYCRRQDNVCRKEENGNEADEASGMNIHTLGTERGCLPLDTSCTFCGSRDT